MPLVKGGRNGDNGGKYKRKRNIPLLAVIGTIVCVAGLIASLMAGTRSTGKLAGVVEKTLEVHGSVLGVHGDEISDLKKVANTVAVNMTSIEKINTACETMNVRFVPRPEVDVQFTELRKAQEQMREAQGTIQSTTNDIYQLLLKQ